jgi:hypothetical protein
VRALRWITKHQISAQIDAQHTRLSPQKPTMTVDFARVQAGAEAQATERLISRDIEEASIPHAALMGLLAACCAMRMRRELEKAEPAKAAPSLP